MKNLLIILVGIILLSSCSKPDTKYYPNLNTDKYAALQIEQFTKGEIVATSDSTHQQVFESYKMFSTNQYDYVVFRDECSNVVVQQYYNNYRSDVAMTIFFTFLATVLLVVGICVLIDN